MNLTKNVKKRTISYINPEYKDTIDQLKKFVPDIVKLYALHTYKNKLVLVVYMDSKGESLVTRNDGNDTVDSILKIDHAKIYTSSEILESEGLYDLQDSFSSSGSPFKYQMTEGELHWARYIKGKYGISAWVLENLQDGILAFNCPSELKEVIESDGMDNKAVMLSDETALQKLFFWLS